MNEEIQKKMTLTKTLLLFLWVYLSTSNGKRQDGCEFFKDYAKENELKQGKDWFCGESHTVISLNWEYLIELPFMRLLG